MATRAVDFEEHKRKIFLERLNPRTTTGSLREYLSGFEIELCAVPSEEGRNKGHGFVIFRKESSVNAIMSQRPHTIDGQLVQLYRSVPDQGSLKENAGIKELIVSGFKVGSINKSDLERYFCGFGKINHIDMKYTDDSCCIKFEDYDSVDKALLDRPHKINNIELDLRKASRRGRFETSTPTETTTIARSNHSSIARKKSNIKQVTINSERTTINISYKIYCIHISNLPPSVDAATLSGRFNWPIRNILMESSSDISSLPLQCWLKDLDNRQTAEDFVRNWDGKTISGSRIVCDVEEDRLELCNKFRTGECSKTSEVCDWEHIPCTANGKCSSDCPYGHREGMKGKLMYNLGLSDRYQVKITGFQKKLTPDILSKMLNEKNCFVKPSQESVGYIGPIRTIKYARRLLSKWHNKSVDEQILTCQIEWHQRSSISRASSHSRSDPSLTKNETNLPHHSRRGERMNDSRKTSRYPSGSRDDSDSEPRVVDDAELNCEPRIYHRSREDIIKQKAADIKQKTKSNENLSSSADQKCQNLNEISKSSRKMSKLRSKTDGSFAFLIEYDNTDREIYRRELAILQMLKGVKGVIQLIEPKTLSDDDDRSYSKSDFSFITQYESDDTLKSFAQRIHHGHCGVLRAVQLVQNLIKIIKQIHAKGILHQNLEPESILIKWDSKKNSADEAEFVLINFSHAHIISEKNARMNPSSSGCWYKPPQADVESYKYTSTIDASSICAILLWLITNTDPRHDQVLLPHQHDNVMDKLNKEIAQAVRNANQLTKLPLEESQLKRYLIDTFNIGFGYPEYQPWTIGDLECRLESIRELLLPRDRKLITTDAIFKDLASVHNTPLPASSTTVHKNLFEKATIAIQGAKSKFSDSNDQCSWSDGGCTWLDSTQTAMNERRHDDILTFDYRDGRMSGRCSIIVTCLATLIEQETCIALSISSVVNGKMSRIPIGYYSKSQNFTLDLQKDFIIELNNLIKSIANQRRTLS